MDTAAHADYFAQLYRIDNARMGVVWVGADTEYFYPPATGEQQHAPQSIATPNQKPTESNRSKVIVAWLILLNPLLAIKPKRTARRRNAKTSI